MTIIVSYRHLYSDWYVGELYTKFFEFLKDSYKDINFVYMDIFELCEKFGGSLDYTTHGLPSVFSPYNLIIMNTKTEKVFVHSLHDYAAAMLPSLLELQKQIGLIKFCFCSNLTSNILNETKYDGITLQPSFYCLENLTDYDVIEQNKRNVKADKRPFFAGLIYGDREPFKKILKESSKFNFLDKRDSNDYLEKNSYYKQLSQCLYGMSFNGAAKICYRDLEYFGLGVLNLREHLDISTVEPLIEDVHYINFFDNDTKNNMWNYEKKSDIIQILEYKLNSIIETGKHEYITNNSKNWYSNNCTPESNIKWLSTFVKDFSIF